MPNLNDPKRRHIRWRLDATNWIDVLENIERFKSYYVGGSLFVDLEEGVFGFHLDGSLIEFETGMAHSLSREELFKVFEVYRRYKGETSHYRKYAAVFRPPR